MSQPRTDRELMQQALEMIEDARNGSQRKPSEPAITALRERLAQPEQPKVRTGDCLLVGVCASEGHKIQPQRTEQEPVAWLTEERYAQLHTAQRPEERNFCPRCGKRTQDIHTCTPPQEKNT